MGVYLDMGTFSLHRSDDITFLSKEYYGIFSIKMGILIIGFCYLQFSIAEHNCNIISV